MKCTSAAICLVLVGAHAALAQLEITEVMINPLSADDAAWEWIEVKNNSSFPIDLNGAFAGRVGDAEVFIAAVSSFEASNTVIPANGVAVLYDGFLSVTNPSNFNDQHFRDAWGLTASVPLVAVNGGFPPLTNGGAAFGFWADAAAYAVDVDEVGSGREVLSLTNTLFDLDFTSGNHFPPITSGNSIRWSGIGDYRLGTNWELSAVAETGVVTSGPVVVAGATNSTADIGSPGLVPGGNAAAGLLISEIMYNPRSPEGNAEWEWVEIHNNTGSDIDFETTPYFLDDDDGGPLSAGNIGSGAIAQGTTAILYNDDRLEVTDLRAAWDSDDIGTNFIPVTAWPGFANGGDLVALWDDLTGYSSDEAAGTTTHAVATVFYDDFPADPVNPWPRDDGNGSIYLADLAAADPNVGAEWMLSAVDDGFSMHAAALPGFVTLHPGGDIGSPGTFVTLAPSPVDLDVDGDVDGNDFLLIQRTNPALIPQWELQYGSGVGSLSSVSSVPESTSIAWVGVALAIAASVRLHRPTSAVLVPGR